MKPTLFKIACLTLTLSLPCLVLADEASPGPVPQATIHGKIHEQGSPDPLAEAVLEAESQGLTLSAQSDSKGNYSLSLAPGTIKLKAYAAGHAQRLKTVVLKAGQDLQLNLALDRTDFTSDDYVVQARKDRPQVITSTLTQREIKKIPGTGGDALRAVQDLPGVAAASDYSSQLLVQGGGPSDNLYFLDNIPWPFPFHFGGIISTVNSDLLSSVDLNAAGFNARWGDSMGAVLDGKTRAGKKDRIHASLDASLIMTQVLVEGPLGLGDASFTLAGRRSYLDLILSHLDLGDFTAFPVFWDLGASLDFSLGANNHIRALALDTDDTLGFTQKADDGVDAPLVGEAEVDNGAVTSGFSWTNNALPGLKSTFSPYFSSTHILDSIGSGFDVSLYQKTYGIKEELDWQAGSLWGMSHELGLGGGAELTDYSVNLYAYEDFSTTGPSGPLSTTASGQVLSRWAYAMDRIQLSPSWAVTAGLHYDKNDLVADDLFEPRVSLEWRENSITTWKAAWGIYDQFPSGNQLNADLGNPELSANQAQHTVLSLERKFSPELYARIDAYYKAYQDLVISEPEPQSDDNEGSGDARGLELFIKENMGERFFAWLSYAYSVSERLSPPQGWALYRYDQTHILTLVSNYNFTPAWSLGSKLRYNSGPLIQSLQGRYLDSYGNYRGLYAETYDQRLGDYLRWDLRTDYTWRLQSYKITLYAEVLNVLGRQNPYGVTYPKDYAGPSSVIDNLPRFPYLGVEFEY